MAKKILAAIVAAVLLSACEGFFLEEVDYKSESHEPTLVVNALFLQKSSQLHIMLYETATIGSDSLEELREGRVNIFVNDIFIKEDSVMLVTWGNPSETNYAIKTTIDSWLPGDQIMLEVKHPKHPSTTAKVKTMHQPTIDNYFFEKQVRNDPNLGPLDSVSFKLSMNPQNVGVIVVDGRYINAAGSAVNFYSKSLLSVPFLGLNPDFINGYYRFSQKLNILPEMLNDQSVSLSLYSQSPFNDGDSLDLELGFYDIQFYDYYKQFNQQLEDIGNIFISPKPVKGSWSKSQGFFGVAGHL